MASPPRYGRPHRRVRQPWEPLVAAGQVQCARCHRPILPGEPWDLGHVDGGDPKAYVGPEHARCNRATASRHRRPSVIPPDYPADDPENGVYWGEPDPLTGAPRRWSRLWHDWRSEYASDSPQVL